MVVPLVGYAWRYPLRGNTDQLVDIGKMARYETDEFVGYVGGMAVLFLLYALALRESRRLPARRALPVVFVCGGLMAAAMAWMYPVNAIDLFIYAVRSRLWTTYHQNPLSAYPIAHWQDPYMHFASPEWARKVSPYGPLWNLIAWPTTALGGDRLAVALVGFKVLAVAADLTCGAIVVWTLRVSRSEAATGALFFLWNPLVLWEGIGNGHNDLVLAVPLLLALLAWVKRRTSLVIPLLVVGALIKYVTLLLIPVAAIALWRRAGTWQARRLFVAESIVLSAIAAGIAFFPFYDIHAVRTSLSQQGDIFLTSPAAMAIGLLKDRYRPADIERWAKLIGEVILVVVMAWQAVQVWEVPRRLPRAAFEVLYVFLLVATWNFRAWYLVWPVALAALLPWGWPAWRTIAWTAGGLAMYALFIWGWDWWKVDFYTIQNVGVPLILGATVFLTLAELATRVVSRRGSAAGGEVGTLSPARGTSTLER